MGAGIALASRRVMATLSLPLAQVHPGVVTPAGEILPGHFAPVTRSAIEMIRACFRHQHPEEFGASAVNDAAVPARLRYGSDDIYPSGAAVPEEPMGNPGAVAV
jgi:hypothetical protein